MSGKSPALDSSSASEPWTEEGSSWGGSGADDRLVGARAMARLVRDKVLPQLSFNQHTFVALKYVCT